MLRKAVLAWLDERYGEDRGVRGIWSNWRRDASRYWDSSWQLHPFTLALSVEVQVDPDATNPVWHSSLPLWIVTVTVGPFSVWLARMAQADMSGSFAAWHTDWVHADGSECDAGFMAPPGMDVGRCTEHDIRIVRRGR